MAYQTPVALYWDLSDAAVYRVRNLVEQHLAQAVGVPPELRSELGSFVNFLRSELQHREADWHTARPPANNDLI